MGSEVVNPIKPRIDLSMSRRTRKPWSSNLVNEMQHQDLSTQRLQPKKEEDQDREIDSKSLNNLSTQSLQPEKEEEQEQDQDREIDRKSLNNLMRCEQGSNEEANDNNKNSLGQHFGEDEEIKQTMQLVVKKKGGESGVKFKGMMGRYVKVLTGLMKAKRDRKITALRV